MPDEPKPRRVPLGEPLTEAELLAMAEITPADIAAAKERWRQTAPRAFRSLLDAERDDGTA